MYDVLSQIQIACGWLNNRQNCLGRRLPFLERWRGEGSAWLLDQSDKAGNFWFYNAMALITDARRSGFEREKPTVSVCSSTDNHLHCEEGPCSYWSLQSTQDLALQRTLMLPASAGTQTTPLPKIGEKTQYQIWRMCCVFFLHYTAFCFLLKEFIIPSLNPPRVTVREDCTLFTIFGWCCDGRVAHILLAPAPWPLPPHLTFSHHKSFPSGIAGTLCCSSLSYTLSDIV